MGSVPWIPFAATIFLETIIEPDMKVFEWGAGESTIFFAERVAEVVSIEHDERYYHQIMAKINEAGLDNVSLKLIPADPGRLKAHANPNHPDNYFTHVYERDYSRHNFRNYVTYIDEFPDCHFDVVMIDGMGRSSCLKHAPPKIRSGGCLIFDNSDREYYFDFVHESINTERRTMEWEEYTFWGHGPDYAGLCIPWKCTIWRKLTEGE